MRERKGSCQVEDFGREWLKQFIQLQLLRLLRQAGVSSTALQLLSASPGRKTSLGF